MDPVEDALHRARLHRMNTDPRGALAQLDIAWEQVGDGPERARVAWKRAKARFDCGLDTIDAIEPVLDDEALFESPQATRGAERLARAHQDQHGFHSDGIRTLWSRLGDHHWSEGDRYRAVLADLQLAWDAAVRGIPLEAHLERLQGLQPADLVGGATWHPDAEDAPSSLPWLHLEAAHTALRAALWRGDHDAAAAELQEIDALTDDTGIPPHVGSALGEAAFHLGRRVVRTSGTGFHADFTAELAGAGTVTEEAPGPEWRCAVLLARNGAADPALQALATRFHCTAFTRH